MKMSPTALPALSACIGGAISWIVAAAFDYRERDRAFSDVLMQLKLEIKHDPSKAKEIGDVNEAAANRTGGIPSFIDSLVETYAQPLFVSSFTGGATFFASPKNSDLGLPLLVWIAVTGLVLVVTILNAKGLSTAKVLRRWYVVVFAWIVVLAVSLYSAWAASQPTATEPKSEHGEAAK